MIGNYFHGLIGVRRGEDLIALLIIHLIYRKRKYRLPGLQDLALIPHQKLISLAHNGSPFQRIIRGNKPDNFCPSSVSK